MTYNLFFKNRSPSSSLTIIKESNPDILLVQELIPSWEKRLNNSIGKDYPYRKTLPLRGTHGIGIYSKYPILANHFLKNESSLPFAQIVEVKIGIKRIQLVNTHLASPAIAIENPDNFLSLFASNYRKRISQLQKINSLTRKKEFNVQIMAGDLNTTRYEPLFRNIESEWVDLFSISGIGSQENFPNSSKTNPLLALDYIFARGALNSIETQVIEGGGSDHLAIIGKIEI
ncbi:MAG: endonuclease/exonuclease/phosphatase family protein [Bacteroidota bacterium]